jgi:hypothetical protein
MVACVKFRFGLLGIFGGRFIGAGRFSRPFVVDFVLWWRIGLVDGYGFRFIWEGRRVVFCRFFNVGL